VAETEIVVVGYVPVTVKGIPTYSVAEVQENSPYLLVIATDASVVIP
jgi:hypothetical protein